MAMANRLTLTDAKFASDHSFHTGKETVTDQSKQEMFQDMAVMYREKFSAECSENILSIAPSRQNVTIQLKDGTKIRDFGDSILAPYNPTDATYSALQEMCDARLIEGRDVKVEGDISFKPRMKDMFEAGINSLEANEFLASQNLDDPELDKIEVIMPKRPSAKPGLGQ